MNKKIKTLLSAMLALSILTAPACQTVATIKERNAFELDCFIDNTEDGTYKYFVMPIRMNN